MSFYALTKIVTFIGNERIKAFHFDMFHGIAIRDGYEYPHDPKVWAHSDAPTSLEIIRSGGNVPAISEPSNLVVNERLANSLSVLRNIRLQEVVFRKLVDIDYQAGDMSWWGKWGSINPCELLKSRPDVQAMHNSIGRYFEVQLWDWEDVAPNYSDASEITITNWKRAEPTVVKISARMLQDYPILWGWDTLLSAQAYSILKDDIDSDYFIVREYQLPPG